MKKIHEKRLHFVSSLWFRPLIMTKLCILFLIYSMTSVSASTVFADDPGTFQQNTVKGTVMDAATGEALIGVSVVVKGTTTGQLTDINGKFSIPVTAGQTTLIFSFIGYTTQEVAATPGSDLTVAMELAVTQISEVVVVGYGSAPLVLVDGVERDFSSLDPNEINSISVLKDASATAVFGAKHLQ